MDIRTNPNRILLIANHFLTLIYLRVYCQYSNTMSLFSVSSIIQYHGNTIEIILERTLYEILMRMCLFSTIFFNRMQSRRVTQILPSDHFKWRHVHGQLPSQLLWVGRSRLGTSTDVFRARIWPLSRYPDTVGFYFILGISYYPLNQLDTKIKVADQFFHWQLTK